MATLIQFSRNIRKRGSQIENAGIRMVKASAIASLKSLVRGTRVDKGVARSNWRVGIGAPTRSVIAAYSPHPKGSKGSGQGMGETANATAAIAAGINRINLVSAVRGRGLETSIYISNAISYPQAAFPSGLVDVALLESSRAIQTIRVFTR